MVFSTGSLFSKNDSSRFVKILAYISIRMRIFETKDVCAFSSISHTIQWISDRFQQMSPKSNVDVAVFLRHCYFWSKIAGIDSPGFMYRFCYFLHMMWKLCADLRGRYFSIFLDRWHGNKWSNLHMTWDSGCYCRFWIHFGKQFLEVPFLGCHLWPCPPRQWDSRSLT